MKREHFGVCYVSTRRPLKPGTTWGTDPTMEGAYQALDPFNDATYWPLRNVIPYLGRMDA